MALCLQTASLKFRWPFGSSHKRTSIHIHTRPLYPYIMHVYRIAKARPIHIHTQVVFAKAARFRPISCTCLHYYYSLNHILPRFIVHCGTKKKRRAHTHTRRAHNEEKTRRRHTRRGTTTLRRGWVVWGWCDESGI